MRETFYEPTDADLDAYSKHCQKEKTMTSKILTLDVYDSDSELRASLQYAEDAGCLVAFLGEGSTIREKGNRKHILWSEGNEEQPAAESYDFVAETVWRRMK